MSCIGIARHGIKNTGGMEASRTFVEEERRSLREGSTPEGWFFFKKLWEDVPGKWKQDVCRSFVCFWVDFGFSPVSWQMWSGQHAETCYLPNFNKFRKFSFFEKVREKKSTILTWITLLDGTDGSYPLDCYDCHKYRRYSKWWALEAQPPLTAWVIRGWKI